MSSVDFIFFLGHYTLVDWFIFIYWSDRLQCLQC